jgi:hypothetical protein
MSEKNAAEPSPDGTVGEDERSWPWPSTLTGDLLAQALGIPLHQNRALRRKLHGALLTSR